MKKLRTLILAVGVFLVTMQGFSYTKTQAVQKLGQARNLYSRASRIFRRTRRSHGYDRFYNSALRSYRIAEQSYRRSHNNYNTYGPYADRAIRGFNIFISRYNNDVNRRRSQAGNNNRNNNAQAGSNRSSGSSGRSAQANSKVSSAENYLQRAQRLDRRRGARARVRHFLRYGINYLNSAKRYLRIRNYNYAIRYADKAINYFRRFIRTNGS